MDELIKIYEIFLLNGKIEKDDINLVLNDGDFTTVIGGNGAGKSTLQNIIAGTYLPDYGTIEINGSNITKLPEYKRAKYTKIKKWKKKKRKH